MNPYPTRAPVTQADLDDLRDIVGAVSDLAEMRETMNRLLEWARTKLEQPEPILRRRSEADQLMELRAQLVGLTERVARLEAAQPRASAAGSTPESEPGPWVGNVRWWGPEGEDAAATVRHAIAFGWTWNAWRRGASSRFACGTCPTREEAMAAADAALAGLSS